MRRVSMCWTAAMVAATAAGLTATPASATRNGTEVSCNTSALTMAIANAAAGDTLTLARHCTYHLTTAYVGGDGLPPITKRLTIRGCDATIVRDSPTAGPFRIFDVASGGDLRIDDLTIRHGHATGDGGGIRVQSGGTLSLESSSVIDNTADSLGGGVDVALGGTATIKNSLLTRNNAGDTGGGLQSDGTVNVYDSRLTYNYANTFGGAVDHESGTAEFHRTSLRDNTSRLDGGGIDIDGGTVKFVDSGLTNNITAGTTGGGIWNGGATLTLERTEVTGNTVAGGNGKGGGIYNTGTGTQLTLHESTVDGNSANGPANSQGGGIYNTNGTVTLDRSRVQRNDATTAPGGVWTNVPFTVQDSEIKNNIPSNCTGSPVVVTGCTG
ncbi:hypothetical protein ACFWA5_36235 [Streptomyces mirabilis]|uniref:hypothetical protein n=1 Tax=Streptomyces mirabilis TaxID=68239 RepID=UPI00364C40DA